MRRKGDQIGKINKPRVRVVNEVAALREEIQNLTHTAYVVADAFRAESLPRKKRHERHEKLMTDLKHSGIF